MTDEELREAMFEAVSADLDGDDVLDRICEVAKRYASSLAPTVESTVGEGGNQR